MTTHAQLRCIGTLAAPRYFAEAGVGVSRFGAANS